MNRELKQITTRLSHFRRLDMADFMAYLDLATVNLEIFVVKIFL